MAVCPYCQSPRAMIAKRFTTAGVITLLAGILFAPVCIGLLLIPMAFAMREDIFVCSDCGRRYQWQPHG